MRVRNFIVGLLTLIAAPAAVASPAWSPCHLPGQGDALRCATLAVPRDYADTAAGTLPLHVAVAPAIRARAEPDPLFVLAGGPGQAGSDIVFLLDTALAKVRATRDIVFIDQRGTGRSGNLRCADDADVLSRSDDELKAATLACLRGYGKDLLFYSTEAAAHDIEQVRLALGAAQINLWGGSYGTRLAQAHARLYPGSVRSLILDGVVDAQLSIGDDRAEFEAALNALLQRCAADRDCSHAFPALRSQLDALLHKLDDAAVTTTLPHPRSGQPMTLSVSRLRLLAALKAQLYSTQGAARLPYVIARAAADDWRPLLALQANSIDLAAAAPAPGLLLTLTCREDWPRLTPAQREQAADSIGASSFTALDALCRELALPALAPAAAPNIAAPALLLSGALDPVTPPARAELARRNLSQAQHVVVDHVAHIVSGLGCSPRLLRQFLDAPLQAVDASCLADIALPPFQTSAAGAAP